MSLNTAVPEQQRFKYWDCWAGVEPAITRLSGVCFLSREETGLLAERRAVFIYSATTGSCIASIPIQSLDTRAQLVLPERFEVVDIPRAWHRSPRSQNMRR